MCVVAPSDGSVTWQEPNLFCGILRERIPKRTSQHLTGGRHEQLEISLNFMVSYMLITCVESTHPARPQEVRKLLLGRRASSNQHQLLLFKGHKLFSYLCPTENISRYQLSKEGGRREQATCFSKNKEPDVLLKCLLVLNPLVPDRGHDLGHFSQSQQGFLSTRERGC